MCHTCSHCSHNGRTCISLSLLSNFLWMGPRTISCFHLLYLFDLWPSHCLSWVKKPPDLSPLSSGGGYKECEHACGGITSILNWFQGFLFFLNSTRHSPAFWPYRQTRLRWQQMSVWSVEVLLLLCLVAPCLWTPCFYPSHVLIAVFLFCFFLLC